MLWRGVMRGANALGVDIIQQCEVTGFRQQGERVVGVETSHGSISAGSVVLSVAGHSTVLAGKLGLRLPINSMALQAMVSEPIKPCLDTVVLSPTVHMCQSVRSRRTGLGRRLRTSTRATHNAVACRRSIRT